MNNNRMTCDPERIELFLQQKLSDEEQAAFESHLDDCDDCRRRLEAAAAGDDVWSGVRDSLRGQQPPPDSLRSDDSSLDSAAGDDVSSSYDTVLRLLAPTDDDRMLGRLGTYEVVGVVGWGGMGVVLKALDPALNRYVAIKVLAPHLGNSGAARKRFSREAQAAAAVVHDNVMEIYGVADTAGLSYLVMPYVRGPSLQRRLDDDGPLGLVEVLRIGMQAAAGLAAAHSQGLVHRDVKPANILLADGVERVKLTDFGLARAADDASLTRTGIIAGTPQYMSPEQARGESVDQRSDLFSLGSVLYAMCTGRPPFRAETSYGVLRRITDEEPRPIRQLNPDIPEWLCRIIARLMSKQPGDRFASAREVAELLEKCLAHVQQPTAVPLPASLAPLSRGRRFSIPRRRLGVIAMMAAGLCALGMFLVQATDPPKIDGRWIGEGWGQVVLQEQEPGKYTGTYTGTVGEEPGKLQLGWSRIERRFNGTWTGSKDRFGKISVRLVDDEIRGAWTTSKTSGTNPGTPELADLSWTRSRDGANEPRSTPGAAAAQARPADSQPKATTAAPRCVRLFEAVTTGHTVRIACSADGRLIAVANGNPTRIMQVSGRSRVPDWRPTADVLDAETGKTVASLKLITADEDAVVAATRIPFIEATAIAISPDGKIVAVGTSFGQVKLFDARTGRLVRSLDDEKGKLADKETPDNLKPLKRAMGCVEAVAFSPDGSLLAVCGGSFNDWEREQVTAAGRLKVWNVKTGTIAHDLVGHSFAWAVAFSPDGKLLASAGCWFGNGHSGVGAILWDTHTGEKIREIPTNANARAYSVAFSPDNKLMAICSQSFGKDEVNDHDASACAVTLVHVATGIMEWLQPISGWAKPVVFSPDGKSVVVLCGSIRLLDTTTGTVNREIRSADSSQGRRWEDLAIASQGDVLAIGTVRNNRKGSSQPEAGVEVWSTRSGNDAPKTIAAHAGNPAPTRPLGPIAQYEVDCKKLDAMTGWVIAWDTRDCMQHGDGSRCPKLRVFADGRIMALPSCGDPLSQASIDVKEVQALVKELKQRASLRDLDGTFVIGNRFPMLREDYEGFRGSLKKKAMEFNVGDPLPLSLWDQTGERVTIFDGDNIYDLLSVEPEHFDRPDPMGTRNVARITEEIAKRLKELSDLAVIGGRKAFEERIAQANAELRSKIPSTPIRLTAADLSSASRNHDGSLALTFYFSAISGKYSFPSGEIQLVVPAGGTPYVRKAGYCFDKDTDVTWGSETLAGQRQPAASPPKMAADVPRRMHLFSAVTTGHSVRIACSADGRLIAVANGNPTIVHETSTTSHPSGKWKPSADILDAETGKTIVSLKLTTADEEAALATTRFSHIEATALAFSPDGKLLAVGTSIGQIKLFNALTGELVRSLDDEKAKLADKETPQNWKSLRRAIGSVASLAFSPDGSLLAVCGGSFADFAEGFAEFHRMGVRDTGPGRLKLWNVQTGMLKYDLVGHNDQAYAVAFSPDGNWLASAGRWLNKHEMFGNGVILWNAHTGEAIHSLIRTTASAGTRSIAFSPDSKMLVLGTQRFGDDNSGTGGLILVHASSGVEQWLVTIPGWAQPVTFSPDGKTIAVLCAGRSIRFLDVATGSLKHEIQRADSQDVRWDAFAMAPQGHTLVIGTVGNKRKGDAQREVGVEVWSTRCGDSATQSRPTPDVAAQKPDELPLRFGGAIISTNRFHPNFHAETIACSPDGKLIAVGNAAQGKSRSTNGRVLIDGNWRPRVDVFDADSKLIAALKLTTPEEDALLAEASMLWYTHWGPERSPYFEVNSLAFSPDGSLVAVGTSVGQVKLFNAHTGKLVRSLDDQKGKQADKKTTEKYKSFARAMGSVESLQFSPDGSLLAVAGCSFDDNPLSDQSNPPDEYQREQAKLATGPGRLKVWDVTSGTLKHDLLGHSRVHGVAFSPDGNFLASAGSWRNENEGGKGVTVEGEGAIIWSAWTGAKLRVINRPASCGTRSVAFSPDNRLIAIGSRNVHNGRVTGNPNLCVAQVLAPVTLWQQGIDIAAEPVAFSPDGKNVIVSGGGLSIRFLDTETGELTRRIGGGEVYPTGYWMNVAVAPIARMLVISATDSDKNEPGFISVWKMRGREETDQSPSTLPPKTAGIIPQRLHHFPTDDAVGAIACSPDGKLIAIGNGCPAFVSSPDAQPAALPRGWKPLAAILDAETGKTLVSLKLTSADEDAALSTAGRVANFQVEALAFSPEGTLLAVGTSWGQIKLFSTRSGEVVRVLDDESARQAAKGTPEALKSLKRAMGSIRSLAFSPDGNLLAVGGHTFDEDPFPPALDAKSTEEQAAAANASPAHGQVKVWDVKTGTLKPGLGGSGCGNAVAFSPDGNLLLGSGTWYASDGLGSGAMIWNTHSGQKVRNIKTDNYGFTRHAAFAPDSRMVAFFTFFHGDGGTSVTWLNLADALAGNQMFGQCAHWVNAVAFWPEGKNVAVLTNEQSILFMNTETWAVKHALQPLDVDRGGRFRNFVIAPQAYMLAIGGIDAKKQNFVEVWGPRCAVPSKHETAAAAKQPPAKPAEKPPANIVVEIRGHVVDAATGRTIPYFTVQGGCVDAKDPAKITWGFWSQGRSSPNRTGEFSLTLNWSAGDRARIVAGGYLFQPILTEPPKAGVTKIDDLVIALKRGRQISGHVFDFAGKPVKDAGVFVVGNPSVNLTGGKAMTRCGPPPETEDKGAGRFATDAQGAFTVMGINSDSKGIAITCSALDLWVVPIPKDDASSEKLEIHLPQPGKLVVHYDIAGAPEKATLFRHLHTWEMPGWEGVSNEVYDPIQQHIENVFDNLAPGKYTIYRCKFLGLWGTRLLDRQTVKIESGKSTVADFVRSKGAPITGQVTGLDQFDAPPAIVVWVVSPEGNERDQRHFDAIPLLPGDKPMDGRFTTERIPPGQYRVKAKVGNSLSPPFAGEVLVTVPEEGLPQPVKIPLSRRKSPK